MRTNVEARRLATMASGRNVSWLLETRAANRTRHPFLTWEPLDGAARTYTYGELHDEVGAVAAGLRARGIGPGDAVIIHLENCPEFVITWFALARVGAIAVCTNARSSVDELRYYGEHSGAIAAITQPGFADDLAEALPGLRWLAVTATDAGQVPADGGRPAPTDSFASLRGPVDEGGAHPAEAFDPAWIQYTSGTTSRPKAVVLTHANALWGAKVNAAHEGLGARDVHLIHLPLFHVNALSYSLLSTLWVGASAVLLPRFSASRFWDVSLRHGCTWASMIPFAVRALGERPVPPDHRYRMWGLGASVPAQDERFGVRTMGWYGMTETVSHPVMDEPEHAGRPGCMGRPTPEYQVSIRHEEGREAEVGESGVVHVRGVPGLSLFAEYLHDPAATADAIDDDGWLVTGDVVAVEAGGFLRFADRAKDLLKVGGENVAASEVERVIADVPGVGEVAVVAAPHRMLDEVPVAFVIPIDDRPALAEEILAACRRQLADFKVPRDVRVVPELPRSTLNKIAKAELRKALLAEPPEQPR